MTASAIARCLGVTDKTVDEGNPRGQRSAPQAVSARCYGDVGCGTTPRAPGLTARRA